MRYLAKLVLAAALLAGGPAGAVTIDTFDLAPDGEVSRVITGDPFNQFTMNDASAIGGERALSHGSLGGIAIMGFDGGALDLVNLGIFGGDPTMQTVLTMGYDGIGGPVDGPEGGLSVDMTDGGLSDRYRISGTFLFGSGLFSTVPAELNMGARAYNADRSAGMIGGASLDLGPVVGVGDAPVDFTLELLFSDLAPSGGAFSMTEAAQIEFLFYFNSASTGHVQIDEICTGTAAGCVDGFPDMGDGGDGGTPVPLPAAGWLMLSVLGLVGLRRSVL